MSQNLEEDTPAAQLQRARLVIQGLIAERLRIMDALTELTNATARFVDKGIRIKGEPSVNESWLVAYALCAKWEQVYGPIRPAPGQQTQIKEPPATLPVVQGQ